MIQNSESIESMLNNIIEMVSIIKHDFHANNKVHYDYVLEKLERAQCDLDNLIKIAKKRKELTEWK